MSTEKPKSEISRELGLKALDFLDQNKIAPAPEYYEIAFHYSLDENAILRQGLNDIMAEKGHLTKHDLRRVYDESTDEDAELSKLSSIRNKIDQQMSDILGTIQNMDVNATQYNQSLQAASEKMTGEVDKDALVGVLNDLIQATKMVESQNKMLEEKLSQSHQHIDELNKDLETIKIENLKDSLTGLSNRRHFEQFMRDMVAAHETGNCENFTLLMLDIDHFKKFNDTFGHQVGDQVLRLVANSMQNNVKGQDLAARYGGEEFAVVLPNTNLESAKVVAEYIRKAVMNKELLKRSTGERLGRITVSVGVASWKRDDTIHGIIERADSCLYQAKGEGRNVVIGEDALKELKKSVKNVA